MVQFKGTLTPQLYRRAIRSHGPAAPWFAVLLLLAGIVGMVRGVTADNSNAVSVPAGVITAGVLLLLAPWFTAWRVFRTNAILRDGFAGTAGEDGFAAQSAYGTSNIPWEKFYQSVIEPEMVLLYLSAQQFWLLPRSFFTTDGEWNEFRTLVAQRVQPRRRGRRFLKLALLWVTVVACLFLLWSLESAPVP